MRRSRDRGRSRGRAELSFDFYDDWDEDEGLENRGVLGAWGNDELDRLLAGSGSHSGPSDQAPGRKRGMSYGTRGGRKSLEADPTVIPSTSALGFLGRLPFKLGGTLRYKPSAADLQDHPGARGTEIFEGEGEPLISDQEENERDVRTGHTRNRSGTTSSGETSDSFRSRGDLFPSDGEDDAVPLDDEFAMVLERRMTNTDDRSSGKTRSSKGKRPGGSRTVSRTISRTVSGTSQSRPNIAQRASSTSVPQTSDISSIDLPGVLSLNDLQKEEDRVRYEEDNAIEQKRQAATQLAKRRGLHSGDEFGVHVTEAKAEPLVAAEIDGPEDAIEDIAPEKSDSTHPNYTENIPKPEPRASTVVPESDKGAAAPARDDFVPARLPHFH